MSDGVAEDDLAWTEACRREEAIRSLLLRHPDRLQRQAVEDVAWELGLSRATLYRLIARYRAARTVDALIEKSVGRPKAGLREDSVRDTLIRQFLEREYLQPTRPSLRRVVPHIAAACREQGLPVPTWRTVKARLLRIDSKRCAATLSRSGVGFWLPAPGHEVVDAVLWPTVDKACQ
jgi:putative transposase